MSTQWKDRRKKNKKLEKKNINEKEKMSTITKQKSEVLKNIMNRKYGNENLIKKSEEYAKLIEEEPNQSRYKKLISKLSFNDFEVLKKLGGGAFGTVLLVKRKGRDELLAMKKLSKEDMIKKKQILHVRSERDVLVTANKEESSSPFIVDLKYSFQDKKYLYLCMEYCPAGDMMTWLIREEIFSEKVTAFYIAELILAVEWIHKRNYVHRDLKPDNILIDGHGHIKLTDFGLCKPFKNEENNPLLYKQKNLYEKNISKETGIDQNKLKKDKFGTLSSKDKKKYWKEKVGSAKKRELLYSTVGSAGYIAPEVLLKKGYRYECDWWSIGVIMFECIFGYPPFYGDTQLRVCRKIVRWKKYLEYPDDVAVSKEAIDLMKMLICDAKERVGTKYTIDDVKNHLFFQKNKIDFNKLRDNDGPFVPIEGESYFSDFDDYKGTLNPKETKKFVQKKFDNDDELLFHDFTFRKDKSYGTKKNDSLDLLKMQEERDKKEQEEKEKKEKEQQE